MDVSEIKDGESLKAWLEDKPKEWAQVLAARIALRVAPMAWSVAALSDKQLAKEHRQKLTLSTFRACFISSAASQYQTDAAFFSINKAAGVAFDIAIDIDIAITITTTFANAATAATDAAAYAATAAHATALAADAAARATALAADGAARAADAAARAANTADDAAANIIWEVIRGDCGWLIYDLGPTLDYPHEPAVQARVLSTNPLWDVRDTIGDWEAENGPPTFLSKEFNKFQTSKLAQETNFGLITDWYQSVLNGSKSPLTAEAERKIALMSSEDWEGEPVEVMDRIAKIAGWARAGDGVVGGGEEEGDLFKPEAINQGIGPTFSANEKKELDRLPALPNFEENQNPALSKIFDRLKKRLNSLKAALGNNLSRYPQLAEILDDYEDALGCSDITEIDIDELWISGVGLISQARAFAALDPSKQVTDPLEPQAQGILGELARLHGGLIMGFSRGRELAEQSGIPLLSNEEFIALLEYEKTIVRWLLESDHYALSDKSRELFQQLDNIFYSTNESADAAAKIGYPVLRNLIIHTANTLEYAEKKAGQLSLVGVPVSLLVTGVLAMLQSNLSPILAFANSVPELRAYLEYHLHRLEIEFEESNKGN